MESDPFLDGVEDGEKLVTDALACLYERDTATREGRGAEATRLTASVRRKISALKSKLDALRAGLESSSITEHESRRREDLIDALRRKQEELESSLSEAPRPTSIVIGMGSPISPIVPEPPAHESAEAEDLDNRSILQLQRNLMQDQDDELEELSRVVMSTKHIGLAVGEELDLHQRLLDDIDDEVTRTGSRLKLAQKMMLAVYRKTSNCKLMMVAALVAAILALLVVAILKHF